MSGKFGAVVVVGLVLGALAGCRNPFASDRVVTLPAADVAVPAELAPGSELVVTVTVVTGGCKRFERFVAGRAADRLTLTARGRDGAGAGVSCPDDIRYEPRPYRAAPPFVDPFTVAVRQPDGTELARVVRIR
jgi:hypothetical protein